MKFETFVRIDLVTEELEEDVKYGERVFTLFCDAPNSKGKNDTGYRLELAVGEVGRGWVREMRKRMDDGKQVFAYVSWDRRSVRKHGGNAIGVGRLVFCYIAGR